MEPTYAIKVTTETFYVEQQSEPASDRYVFAYTITIENVGTATARLIDRHWIITDGRGEVEEVKGDGVVGDQPVLEPGESYPYTSGAMLKTPASISIRTMHAQCTKKFQIFSRKRKRKVFRTL